MRKQRSKAKFNRSVSKAQTAITSEYIENASICSIMNRVVRKLKNVVNIDLNRLSKLV